MTNHQNQTPEERLATFTDAVLSGTHSSSNNALTPEERTVLQLHEAIAPNEAVGPKFRGRLTQRLHDEWDKTKQQRQPRVRRRNILSLNVWTMAAGMILSLIVVALLLNQIGDGTASETTGTALGAAELLVILGGIGIIAAIALFVLNRTQS